MRCEEVGTVAAYETPASLWAKTTRERHSASSPPVPDTAVEVDGLSDVVLPPSETRRRPEPRRSRHRAV